MAFIPYKLLSTQFAQWFTVFFFFFSLSLSDQIPQIILLTFDGAVNLNNYEHYKKIFNGKRQNPNDCDIKGTFFISHEYR